MHQHEEEVLWTERQWQEQENNCGNEETIARTKAWEGALHCQVEQHVW